ncbi:MAG TPA: Ig-like domain-containing protein [Conexibacter sp.]|nr:Ig-like domain-containing protein [Conexibacter sp.]
MPRPLASSIPSRFPTRVTRTLLLAVSALLLAATVAQAAPTVVTLGFDEGASSQYTHRSILAAHNAHATFFVNSGKVGTSGYATWAQLGELSAAGNEIGGNTISHTNLTTLTQAQMTTQVCDDRTAIQSHGLNPTNFSYPSGGWNATAKTVVQGCGYDSARTTGGTDFPDPCCVFAETLPPKNAYTLRAYYPRLSTPLATYEDLINRVRLAGGGWVNIVLSGICDDPCTGASSFSINATTLDQLLGFIDPLPDVTVRTTAQALAMPTDLAPPSVALTGPADGASVTGTATLTADASDDKGVGRVDFLVDGAVVGSDATAPYSADWNTASAGDTATIAARVTDKAGNVVTSASRTVTVIHPDAVPPTVSLTAPANGDSVLGPVTLTADASDNVGVDHVDFLVGGAVVGSDATAPYSFDWDSSSAGSSASIAARAVDVAGNATTSPAATVTVKHASPTVVTFGFDDGLASQYAHRSILQAHGIKATYFINSANVGGAGYVTWSQIADLAAGGNEIAGHTLDHANLPTLSAADQQREVCDDRQALISHGFDVRNFAYPFGAWNAAVKTVVSGCGYLSARTTGGTDYPDGPVYAETVPPKNALTLRAFQPRLTTTLATFQDVIDKARFSGGGWVNLVMHGVCDDPCTGGGDYDTNANTLDQLLTWIGQQPGVTVKTTAQTLGQPADTTAPTAALTTPADGATVQGTVTLSADASDDVGVSRVDFLVDGSVVGSDTTAPYSFDWASGSAGDTATIAARAVDPSGNATTSASRTVTVNHPDAVPPTVTLTAPSDGASLEGVSTLTADADDNVGVDHVDFLVGGAVVGSDATAPYSYDWDASSAGASATIAARAVDVVGNATTSPVANVTVKHASPTVVTLGFDDGIASQYDHRSILQAHGAHATYFINSGNVGKAGYVTWAQLGDLAAGGNEIAGHTLDHANLPTLAAVDQQREVCDDRQALIQHGFDVRNFAYPFGAWDANVKTVVSGCGYLSARTTGGTDYPAGPVYAETVPPKNALTLRAYQPRITSPLSEYQDVIDKARYSGGGWVNFVLHGVCDDPCLGADDYSMSATTLDQLLTWIDQRPGVTIKTEAQELGQPADTTAPSAALTAPSDGSAVQGTTTLTADASDDIGVTRVDFLVDGTVVGSDATAPYSYDWDASTAGASATIAARVVDPSGNVTTSASRTVTVNHPDLTGPTVTLTAPDDGASVEHTVTLSADASDPSGVDHVDFLVDGSVVGTDATAPYSFDWDSSSAGASASIAARAVDALGNPATSAARTLTVKHASPTAVVIGFDDGLASQYQHRSILTAHGVKATYFINSDKVGTSGYATWAQLTDLANAGNEIGGHTLTHANLTTVSAAEQKRQVCDDRLALTVHGFDVRNFAYPFGGWNAGVKSVVAGCGYLTARTTGGLDEPPSCCDFAETVPPKDAMTLRAYEPRITSPLSEYQDLINRARYGGGGVVDLVLHDVCDDPCTGFDEYAIKSDTLDALLTWIGQQPGLSVKTTKDAFGQTGPPPPPPADTVAPTTALTAPASGATVTGTTTITATASDNVAVTKVEFLVNGAVVGSDTTAPYSFDWNTTGAPVSSTVAVRASDAAGNKTTTAARTVTVKPPDTTAPTVALSAPSNGATVSGATTISATASDNVAVTKVEFLANGVVVGTDTTSPYSTSWDSSTSPASVTLTAKAYDAAGNTTTSSARTVTVADVVAPTASLTSPTAGASVTGTVALQGTASDNRAVTRVDFLVGGSVVGQDTTAPYSFNWDSSSAGSSASITMRARDAAGNTVTTPARTVTVIHPDTTAPAVSLTSPANLATVKGNVTLTATASDNVAVTLVEFLVGGNVVGSDATSPYSFVWNSASAGSSATITARARDAAGNTKTSSSHLVFVTH